MLEIGLESRAPQVFQELGDQLVCLVLEGHLVFQELGDQLVCLVLEGHLVYQELEGHLVYQELEGHPECLVLEDRLVYQEPLHRHTLKGSNIRETLTKTINLIADHSFGF